MLFYRNDLPAGAALRLAPATRFAVVLVVLALVAPLTSAADDEAKTNDKGREAAASKAAASKDEEKPRARAARRSASPMPAFTPQREAAAMAFVRQHHGEVADLLERLKENNPPQYRRAASQLFRASERLAQWKDRDPARYELELRAWKVQSRIQLLLARSTMSPDATAADADDELRKALNEQIDVRLALRKHERDQLARRLAAAEQEIAKLSEDREATVERRLAALRQGVEKSRKALKAKRDKKSAKAAKNVKRVEGKTAG